MLKRMVTRHEAGEFVTGGVYWNRKGWDLTFIPEEGGYLPDEHGSRTFYHLPLLAVILLSPIAGMAFVLFLAVAVPVMLLISLPSAIKAAIRRRRGKGSFTPAGMHR